uniref:Uncharacterized protein n=1 Tax=Glossina austeni TaxID=7395 RepID=A0A1A9UPD2_GLOAU
MLFEKQYFLFQRLTNKVISFVYLPPGLALFVDDNGRLFGKLHLPSKVGACKISMNEASHQEIGRYKDIESCNHLRASLPTVYVIRARLKQQHKRKKNKQMKIECTTIALVGSHDDNDGDDDDGWHY